MYFRVVLLVTLLACPCSIGASEDTCHTASLITINNDVSSQRPNMKSSLYDVIIVCVLDGNFNIPPPSMELAESFIKTQEQIGKSKLDWWPLKEYIDSHNTPLHCISSTQSAFCQYSIM